MQTQIHTVPPPWRRPARATQRPAKEGRAPARARINRRQTPRSTRRARVARHAHRSCVRAEVPALPKHRVRATVLRKSTASEGRYRAQSAPPAPPAGSTRKPTRAFVSILRPRRLHDAVSPPWEPFRPNSSAVKSQEPDFAPQRAGGRLFCPNLPQMAVFETCSMLRFSLEMYSFAPIKDMRRH